MSAKFTDVFDIRITILSHLQY